MTYPEFKDHKVYEGAGIMLLYPALYAEQGEMVCLDLVMKGHCVLDPVAMASSLPFEHFHRLTAQMMSMCYELVIFHPKMETLLRMPFQEELQMAEDRQLVILEYKFPKGLPCST